MNNLVKSSLSILFISLVYFSCSKTETQSMDQEDNIDEFRTYPVDITAPATSIFDHIESVEVLGLEETDQSLLTRVSEINFLENHIVFKNGYKDEVLIYSRGGEFMKKIDSKGNGPEEFISVRDLWVKGKLIQIYDDKKVLSFNLNGEFVKSMNIQGRATYLKGMKDGYIADITRSTIQDSLKYNVAFLNDKLERETLAIPYDIPKKTNIFWQATTFSNYKDNILYQHTNGDTIYNLASGKASPLLSIDFGEKWLWKDKDIYQNVQKQRAISKELETISMFFMKVSEKFVFLDTRRSGRFLVNRQSGDYQKLSFDKKGEGRYFMSEIAWEKDRLVFNITSTDIGEFLSQLNPDKITFAGDSSLESIEASENPVLIWVKFKDNLQ